MNCIRILLTILILGCPLPARGQIDESPLNTSEFRLELEKIAVICDQWELKSEAERTRRWLDHAAYSESDSMLQGSVLYLPVPQFDETLGASVRQGWAKRFNAARRRHAAFLYSQFSSIAQQDSERAYRLLWQILREHPEHTGALDRLSSIAKATSIRPRASSGRSTHPKFGWSPGSYRRVKTPHFLLTSRAPARESLALARRLEEIYALWSQVFFPYWAAPNTFTPKDTVRSIAWPKHRNLEVYFLQDRDDYLATLGASEENIGVSVGYYSPHSRQSFFYAADEFDETLVHELTHQLLLEATHLNASAEAGSRGDLWILEGIALYMESLQAPAIPGHSGCWTLGGTDAPRLQTARYRGVRDGYWPEWTAFCTGSLESWKNQHDLARLYSHSAGLSHVLLDAMGQEARSAFFRSLVNVYQGQSDSLEALTLLGSTNELARNRYQDALIVQEGQLRALTTIGRQPQELVLCGSRLTPTGWRLLEQFRDLEWLDLSFSNVADSDLDWLALCTSMKRLSVEGTSISAPSIRQFAKLSNLRELDLSGCAIDDAALRPLAKHAGLEILWLTETQVTDASLEVLETISSLKQCNVQGSQITEEKWKAFLWRHPELGQ